MSCGVVVALPELDLEMFQNGDEPPTPDPEVIAISA
jgi:hypothetical protein